jgi:hypothetical protein
MVKDVPVIAEITMIMVGIVLGMKEYLTRK